jgi:TonB family protein
MATPRTSFSSQIKLFLCLAVVFSCSPVIRSQQNEDSSADRERGIRLYNQNDNKGAVGALRTALKQNKEDDEAWYYLGLALVRVDDLKGARKAFENTLRLKPDFGPARTGLAYALLITGRSREAEDQATRAIELNRNDGLAHYVPGVVRLRSRQNIAARTAAERAIVLRPNLAPAYLLKTQALLGIEGDESARFSKVIRISSNEPMSEAEREERRQHAKKTADLFGEAAAALQTYLKLAESDRETKLWKDQLETLQVFANVSSRSTAPAAFFGWEVSDKVRVLSRPEPTYTISARRWGIVGTVILRAIFSSTGTVEHILVLRSLPADLTEESIQAAKKIKFIPATRAGKPVSSIVELQYNFNLY